jgi:hypothetical protein
MGYANRIWEDFGLKMTVSSAKPFHHALHNSNTAILNAKCNNRYMGSQTKDVENHILAINPP